MQHTGSSMARAYAYRWRFRDGKVTHLKTFGDTREALKAGGLSAEAMSPENVMVVGRGFEAWNAGSMKWPHPGPGRRFAPTSRVSTRTPPICGRPREHRPFPQRRGGC